MRQAPWILGALAVLWLVSSASAQVRMTTGKALKLAFPGCQIQRTTVTLDQQKQAEIRKLCGQKLAAAMVFPYLAKRKGKLIGTAWFDVHKVRSKRQLVMVVVDVQQRVQRVEVLAFAEPAKYAAPKRWLRKLDKQRIGGARPGVEVPRITGATLTVRATTLCVQRVLALHRVVFGPVPAVKAVPPKKAKSNQARTGKAVPR